MPATIVSLLLNEIAPSGPNITLEPYPPPDPPPDGPDKTSFPLLIEATSPINPATAANAIGIPKPNGIIPNPVNIAGIAAAIDAPAAAINGTIAPAAITLPIAFAELMAN